MPYTDLIAGGAYYPVADRLLTFQALNTTYVKNSSNELTDFLTIIETVTGVIEANPHRVEIESTIHIAQVINFTIIKGFTHSVQATQTIVSSIERVINIIDTLPINQYVTKYKENIDPDSGDRDPVTGVIDPTTQIPVSGNSGNSYVEPEVEAYLSGLTPGATVSFSCSGATTLTIKKPEFGDTNSYQEFRVDRTTFGGDPRQVYKDPMWPTYEKMHLEWDYLGSDDKDHLLTFLAATLGKKVTFNNHFGETYIGYIIEPFDQIIQSKRVGWSASFTFQIHKDGNLG